jgi:hypothetical protein
MKVGKQLRLAPEELQILNTKCARFVSSEWYQVFTFECSFPTVAQRTQVGFESELMWTDQPRLSSLALPSN